MLPTRAARALFSFFVPAAVCAAACSSGTGSLFANGDTGGDSNTSTAGAGSGTGAASTTSSSGTTTSGQTSSSGTTTSSSGTTTSSSSTSSSTSASSTTSSGAPAGACTDGADAAKLAQIGMATLQTDVTNCAKNNFGMEPATKNCIAMLGLSAGCTTCFDTNVDCADQHCVTQCFQNPSSAGCVMCIHTNCTPAFNACSGLMGL